MGNKKRNISKLLVAVVLLIGASSLFVGCPSSTGNNITKPKVVSYLKESVNFSFKRPGWPNDYNVSLIPVSKYNEEGIDGVIPDENEKKIFLEMSPHPDSFLRDNVNVITGAKLSSGKIISCTIGFKIGVVKLNSGLPKKYQTIWLKDKSDLQGKSFVIYDIGDGSFFIKLEADN